MIMKLTMSHDNEQHSSDDDDDDDEIAYFTVRWKTRASFVYRTKKHERRTGELCLLVASDGSLTTFSEN